MVKNTVHIARTVMKQGLHKHFITHYCKMCLYSQPYAVVGVTVQMVEVPVHFQRHVHATMDGLDQTVKHVCSYPLYVIDSKAPNNFEVSITLL